MDLAEILKVIIPLVIMAVWAMNLLFNKEVQSPARPMRPMGMPPQDGAPPPLPGQRAPGEYGNYSPFVKSYEDDEAAAARRAHVTPREESYPSVMTVDPRALRRPIPSSAAGTSWQSTPGGLRRGQKAKPKKSESPPTAKGLPTLSQTMTITSNIGKMGTTPIHFTPLSKQQDATIPESTRAGLQTQMAVQGLRDRVRTPAALRESIVINEILRPPLAMRPEFSLRGNRARSIAAAPPIPIAPASADGKPEVS